MKHSWSDLTWEMRTDPDQNKPDPRIKTFQTLRVPTFQQIVVVVWLLVPVLMDLQPSLVLLFWKQLGI